LILLFDSNEITTENKNRQTQRFGGQKNGMDCDYPALAPAFLEQQHAWRLLRMEART